MGRLARLQSPPAVPAPRFNPASRGSGRHADSAADARAEEDIMKIAAVAEREHQGWRPLGVPRRVIAAPWLALLGTGFVVAYLLAAYWASYRLIPRNLSPELAIYVAEPLMWSGLGVLAYLLWRRLPDRPVPSKALVGLAIVAGVFQVSLLISAGLLYGFGHSPYSSQALSMAKNALYFTTLLVGLEMSRAYLVHVWARVSTVGAFGAVVVLYTALAVSPAKYSLAGGREAVLETSGATVLPAASENVMATFLASIGGPLPAIAYGFVLEGFEWFSPILPSLEWPIVAFLGSIAPIVAVLIVHDIYAGTREQAEEEEEESQGSLSPLFLLSAVAVVALIWLNAGMFGVQPALVSGQSMQPTYGPGDVVFTRQVPLETLEIGDVVRFREGGIPVMHRIVDIPEHVDGSLYRPADEDAEAIQIPEGTNGPVFITQGDGNNTPDDPIVAEQIEGKVVFHIPKVGWIPIGIKKAVNWII